MRNRNNRLSSKRQSQSQEPDHQSSEIDQDSSEQVGRNRNRQRNHKRVRVQEPVLRSILPRNSKNQFNYAQLNSEQKAQEEEQQSSNKSIHKKKASSNDEIQELDQRFQSQLTCQQNPIQNILWRRKKQNKRQEQYLVKYKNRSYQKVEWLSQNKLFDQYPKIKMKVKNFNKKFDEKLEKGQYDQLAIENKQYFDQNFVQPDRILYTTQMFPVIHPKKALQLKGGWHQSLQIVVSKLINLTKDDLFISIPFLQFTNGRQQKTFQFGKVVDLGIVVNRIYLGSYKKYSQFWIDIGNVWKSFRILFGLQKQHLKKAFMIMRQASIFLYYQWYHLSQQRHEQMVRQIKQAGTFEISDSQEPQKIIDQQQQNKKNTNNITNNNNVNQNGNQNQNENENENKMDIQQNQQSQRITEKQESLQNQLEEEEMDIIDIEKYSKDNILLGQKKSQIPTTKQALKKFHPGQYSYSWLADAQFDQKQTSQTLLRYQYEMLEVKDMNTLDMNKQAEILYYVKWKNLSYQQSTWEKASTLEKYQDLITEFKHRNKALNKEARQQAQTYKKMHLRLVTEGNNLNPRIKSQINKGLYMIGAEKKQLIRYTQQNAPVFKQGRRLRSYQLDALNWLVQSYHADRNVILGDQMGLGKTIEAIAFLHHLTTYQNVKGPFLVVVPLTTIIQWKRAFQDWTNMNCVLFYDEKSHLGRNSIKNYEWYHMTVTLQGNRLPSKCNKFKVLLTTYETMKTQIMKAQSNSLKKNDSPLLHQTPFQFIIIDQAHRLKGRFTQNLEAINKLPCKRKLLLTGTPIQNNTSQIWTLLNYIEPDQFPDINLFELKYGNLDSQKKLKEFTTMMKPYLLRRMKQDVEKSIPPIQQIIIDVELTDIQKKFYKGIYEKNKGRILSSLNKSSFNNLQMLLRKCCNHPFLIGTSVQQQITQFCTQEQAMKKLIAASGKMVLLDKLLRKFKQQNKKCLVFSQFISVLDLLERYCKWAGVIYQRFDGSTANSQRQDAIDRFNNIDKKRNAFLISTKAGGVGINLTSATVIIIFDSDWNPQNDTQAIARAHRIGQTNEVKVYRLVTSKTYEAEMFDKASKKLGLDKAILYGGDFKNSNEQFEKMSKGQLQTLLKKGIVGLIADQDQQAFHEKNIDEILEKNTRLVKYQMGKNTGASISKSKFVGDNTNCQLELNDPNFWTKALANQPMEDSAAKLHNQLKDFKGQFTEQKQKQFMIKAIKVMDDVIQSKISLKNYRIDQQAQLNKFLDRIINSRKIHPHYRKLAQNWLEDIQRPSRHYRKPTKQDLQISKNHTQKIDRRRSKKYVEQQQQQEYYQSDNQNDKSSTPRPKKQKSDIDSNQNKKENVKKKVGRKPKQQKKQQNKQQKKQQNKQQNKQQKRQQNKQQDKQKESEKQKDQYKRDSQSQSDSQELDQGAVKQKIMTPCTFCQAPYCSSFCNGLCGRTFHRKCRQYVDNLQKKPPPKLQVRQLSSKVLMEELMKDITQDSFTCKMCKNNQFQCQICKENGKYYSDGKDQQEQEIENKMLPCSKCDKFYHAKCIKKVQSEQKNKRLIFTFKKNKKRQTVVICSLHACAKCQKGSGVMNTCIRCPKAYHPSCLTPQQALKCYAKYVICQDHFANQDQVKQKKDFYHNIQIRKKKAANKKKNKKQQSKQKQDPQQNQQAENGTEKQSNENHHKSKKQVVKRKKQKVLSLGYQQLKLQKPDEIDYQNYNEDWCRYCGARYSPSFAKTKFGQGSLCKYHDKKKGMMQKLKETVLLQPLHPEQNTELKYINDFSDKRKNLNGQDIMLAIKTNKKVKTQ